MAFKFFKIGTANARIEELETENVKLKDESRIANENASTVATEAERLKTDNVSKAATIANHATILAAKDAEIATLREDLDGLLGYEGHMVWCGHGKDDTKPCVCGLLDKQDVARSALARAKAVSK